MSSIRQWARSGRPLDLDVEMGVDPGEGMSFSWSGIKLVVDLEIDRSRENGQGVGEIVGGTSVADYSFQQSNDPEDASVEPGNAQESNSLPPGTNTIEDPLLNYHEDEEYCDQQQHSKVEDKCVAGPEPEVKNCTPCTWPDWGDPLPPEEDDDLEVVDFTTEVEKTPISKKVVTFSDVVTFIEPRSLQEERETDSFSYLGSSDDELEQGTDQVSSSSDGNSSDLVPTPVPSSGKGSLDCADVSAASHLLELGNQEHCGDSKDNYFDSSLVSGRSECEFYDPSHDLERLSELVEKIYAAQPQLSRVSGSQGTISSQELGYWTIEVSKDSGRFRMKRIKREIENECKGIPEVHDLDDDNDVLERPPWKRHYKFLSKCS